MQDLGDPVVAVMQSHYNTREEIRALMPLEVATMTANELLLFANLVVRNGPWDLSSTKGA